MREFFTIAIFKIKADIRMNKTTLNSQKEKHSMLSLRRATSVALPGLRLHLDFYPRSPCGERQLILPVKFTAWAFLSTLSLRRATVLLNSSTIAMIFLSTLSLRRATIAFSFQGVQFLLFLSTLSLRRATGYNVITHGNVGDFYPRSPCGERRRPALSGRPNPSISIHALLAESDNRRPIFFMCGKAFLSTLSLRRATLQS